MSKSSLPGFRRLDLALDYRAVKIGGIFRLSPNARFATCEYFDENAFVIKNNNNVKHWQ